MKEVMNIKATSIPNANFIDSDGEMALYYSPTQLGQQHIRDGRDAANFGGVLQMVLQDGRNANARHTATNEEIEELVKQYENQYYLTPEQAEMAVNHRGTEFGLDTADVVTSFPYSIVNPYLFPVQMATSALFNIRDIYDKEKAMTAAGESDERIVHQTNNHLVGDGLQVIGDFGIELLPEGHPAKTGYTILNYPVKLRDYFEKWIPWIFGQK